MREPDYDRAQRLYEEGLVIRRTVGDRVGIARSLGKLIDLLLRRGDSGAANSYLEEYAALRDAVGGLVIFTPALHDLTLDPDAPRLAGPQGLLERELARQLATGELLDATTSYALLAALALTGSDPVAARAYLCHGLDVGGTGYLGTALVLLVCGALAATSEVPRRAVSLAAAAMTLVTARRAALPWGWEHWRERWLQPARAALGAAGARAARSEGAGWSLDQAIDRARACIAPLSARAVSAVASSAGIL